MSSDFESQALELRRQAAAAMRPVATDEHHESTSFLGRTFTFDEATLERIRRNQDDLRAELTQTKI